MALDATSQLGKLLGTQVREQNVTKQNIEADDPLASFVVSQRENVVVGGTVVATKKSYSTTAFILDHPVYGELDSSTLELDGGYLTGGVQLPLTMPITFIDADEVLFTGIL